MILNLQISIILLSYVIKVVSNYIIKILSNLLVRKNSLSFQACISFW